MQLSLWDTSIYSKFLNLWVQNPYEYYRAIQTFTSPKFSFWFCPKTVIYNTSTQTILRLLMTLTTLHEKRSLPHHAIPFQLFLISLSLSADISSGLCSHNHPNLRSIKHLQSTLSTKTRIFLCLIKHHMTNLNGWWSIAPRIFNFGAKRNKISALCSGSFASDAQYDTVRTPKPN